MDDTLYLERDFVASGMLAVATWAHGVFGMDLDATRIELLRLNEREGRGRTFDAWLARHGFETRWATVMVDVYRAHRPQIKPLDGAPELLAGLKRHSLIGLISDGLLAVQERKLDALGIRGLFDSVVFSDQFGRDAWKPSTRPFVEMTERLGVCPTESVYVADNPAKDFFGARKIGMKTVRVRHAEGLYRSLEPKDADYRADWEIGSLDELNAFFDSPEIASCGEKRPADR
jgi:putative hydrolase of the HAD superfamily